MIVPMLWCCGHTDWSVLLRGSCAPPLLPFPALTVRVLSREGLRLSIGVGGEGALRVWPLWVAPLGIGALRVAPLGVGAGAMGIPWLTIWRRLKRGLWVWGPRVGSLSIRRHRRLGPSRIARVVGRVAVPRHQETLFVGHGLRCCRLPLEEKKRTVMLTWLPQEPGLWQPHLLSGTQEKGDHDLYPGM